VGLQKSKQTCNPGHQHPLTSSEVATMHNHRGPCTPWLRDNTCYLVVLIL
jgi:hypothetical protein